MTSSLSYPGPLVSAAWLQENIHHPQVVVLDASWHLPRLERDGREEWQNERIPGAAYFDYDGEIKDQDSDLPRMLPGPDLFQESVRKLGVNSDSIVVVYDTNDLFSSPRAWWMFRAMGHRNVSVLNGGFKAWKARAGETESGESTAPDAGNFTATLIDGTFIGTDLVTQNLDAADTVICDARSTERFNAAHMPGAKSMPYSEFLEDGYMKANAELKEIISQRLNNDQSLICSCGSGVTACILALASELAGIEKISVYDGSWTEWSRGDNPVVSEES